MKGMPKADQDLRQVQAAPRWIMDSINRATRALKDGAAADLVLILNNEVKEVLAPILARYQAAVDVATLKREQEILTTPIDDAAWKSELERRARIVQWRILRFR